jgi:methylated-DNA-[protein]-cysteine S-methyltransferase
LASVLEKEKLMHLLAASPGEGEVWVGRRGCRVSLRGGAVVATRLLEGEPLFKPAAQAGPALEAALREVGEYLLGERRHFSVASFMEGPPFYRAVWEKLRQLPYGETISYGELAAQAGRPGSARAVGSAMRLNPLVLITPCHRVTASGGKLGGFSAGTDWKKFLLKLEGGAAGLEFKA